MKKLIQLSLACTTAMALEFGGLGTLSPSMGYAGVALKNNDFALFYNPALLSYSKSSFALSSGLNFSQKNLLELTSIDSNTDKRIEQSLQNVTNIFDGQDYGSFKTVIDDFATKNENSTNPEIKELANSMKSNTSLTTINDKVKADPNLANAIKNELLASIDATSKNLAASGVDVNLTKNIISSVDTENILDLLDASRQGQASDITQVTNAINEVKLSAFLDSKTLDDLNTIYKAVYDNEVNASVSSGMELNLVNLYDDYNSACSVGVFNRVAINTYAGLNKTKSKLIINIKDGTKEVYLELSKQNGELVVKQTTQAEYDNFSAFAKNTKNNLIARTLILTEVPVGYARTIDIPFGELSLGGSVKYIHSVGYYIDKGISINTDGVNSDELKFKDDLKNPAKTHTLGLDIGALYSYSDFSAGLVVKNLNNPKVKFQHGHSIKLNPQVRLGAAYNYKLATFALDIDVLSNKTLSYRKPKSQMIGGGVKLDFTKWFNLRAGMAYDMKKDDGLILTTGLGLFNVFDLSFASSTKTSKYTDSGKTHSIPTYLDFRFAFAYHW